MLTLTTERQMITKRCSLDEDHHTVYSTGAFAVNVQSKTLNYLVLIRALQKN